MATVASTCGSKLEALAHIDISKLSQSELHALSLCSDSAYDLRRNKDVVFPQIDRSLFNESAGSRRQTYSRLRHPHHRSRVPGLHPSTSQPKPPSTSDPENHAILHFLKYFIHNPNSQSPPPPLPPPPPPQPVPPPSATSGIQEKTLLLMNEHEKKRKRGRKPKDNKKLKEKGVEIVNKNGEVVDLNNLENNGDKLYSEELEKRTVGLQTEEELHGFVRGLEGQWCSRRKRRKYVDASGFGDTLPIGWNLLLALRRRDGRVWVYCRRIVSPTGQQFLSCKEASSYLRSHFLSGEAANQPTQQVDDTVAKSVSNFHSDTSLVLSTGIQENPRSLQKGYVAKHDVVAHAVVPNSSTLDLHLSEVCLMEMDNLPEVKVQDIFECYKCNLTFEEKNAYLQHLFSFHQRTTRRYRVGPSVGDGVIIRDGKYECQFCHKVFEERRSYNGHVGVHVRNNARGTVDVAAVAADKGVQSPHHDGFLSRTCKMDALVEIAQNSVVETSSAKPKTKGSSLQSSTSIDLDGNMAINTDQVARSNTDTGLSDTKGFKVETCLEQGKNQPDNTFAQVDKDKSGEILANKFNPRVISTNDFEQPACDDAKKAGSNKAMQGLGNKKTKENDDVQSETMELTFQEIASQNALTSSSVSMVQSLHNDFEHSEDGVVKKDRTDKAAVGKGNSLAKANDVVSETMQLTFQENATLNGLTSFSASMVQPSHSAFEHPESDNMRKDGNNQPEVCLGHSLTEANNDVESETMEFTLQQNATQDGLAGFSEPMVQSLNNSTGMLSGSSKNLDNGTGFEELRLDEIEHFEYSFDDGRESPSLPPTSIGLGNDARMEEAFASVGFNSGGIILNMEELHQLSTICVWCRAEFKLEAYDTEAHSDSIGFMCPDCKAKISGHLESVFP